MRPRNFCEVINHISPLRACPTLHLPRSPSLGIPCVACTACRPNRPLQAVCAHARTGPDRLQGQLGDAHLPGRRHRGDPQPVPQERRADLIVTSYTMHSFSSFLSSFLSLSLSYSSPSSSYVWAAHGAAVHLSKVKTCTRWLALSATK